MEKRILIPLSEYGKQKLMPNSKETAESEILLMEEFYRDVPNYIYFITQPISLGQFIACDEDGNVLKKPENFNAWSLDMILPAPLGCSVWYGVCEQFQDAQERVIFKGFVKEGLYLLKSDTRQKIMMWSKNGWIPCRSNLKTLEDLTHLKLELTDNALK